MARSATPYGNPYPWPKPPNRMVSGSGSARDAETPSAASATASATDLNRWERIAMVLSCLVGSLVTSAGELRQDAPLQADEGRCGAVARMCEIDRHDGADAARPRLHDHDAIAEVDRFLDVMGHHDHGH